MKYKFIALLLIAFALISCEQKIYYAGAFEIETLDNDTVRICSCRRNYYTQRPQLSGIVRIPETVYGKKVVEIGTKAFSGCNEVIEFIIPKSVVKIAGDAFKGCSSLKTINFNDITISEGSRFYIDNNREIIIGTPAPEPPKPNPEPPAPEPPEPNPEPPTPNKYTINFTAEPNEGGSITATVKNSGAKFTSGTHLEENTVLVFKADAKADYSISKWEGEGLNISSDKTTAELTVKKNAEIKVIFTKANNQPEPPTEKGKTYNVKGVSFTMKHIEAVTDAVIGDNSQSNNKEHKVSLSAYCIGETEVTQELWQTIMNTNPSNFTDSPKNPVEKVSWYDCIMFCNELTDEIMGPEHRVYKINGKEVTADFSKQGFRLPTEAEWEYAAMGGKWQHKYAGCNLENRLEEYAWYKENSGDKTHEVGKKKANKFGLYDMSGNVWEWCWDWYSSEAPAGGSDPVGAASGSYRVVRGGSWRYNAKYSERAFRSSIGPGYGDDNLGLRLACRLKFIPPTEEGKTYNVKSINFKMKHIEAVTDAVIGDNSQSNNKEHKVSLSAYYIGETEVTQELWQVVMGTNPSNFTYSPKNPVEKVNWYDCIKFCNKLTVEVMGEDHCVYEISGALVTADFSRKDFRLPTEAEWEYAAMGGKKHKYAGCNLESELKEYAWYEKNSGNKTHEVGKKKVNEFGLYDMSGNVWEWCWDWYSSEAPAGGSDPVGAASGSSRVLRGGSWDYNAKLAERAYRNIFSPGDGLSYLGLRLACRP